MNEIYYYNMGNTNKDLIQSYQFTTIRANYGIYAYRTLIRLVEIAQALIEGLNFKYGEDCRAIEVNEDLWGIKEVIMPISAILPENDKTNYTKARHELKKLQGQVVEYQKGKKWVSNSLIYRIEFDENTGRAKLLVGKEIWQVFMDFSKGFRKYELNTAFRLKSTYSLRLYQLVSGQQTPLTYKIEDLKQMLGIPEKYPRPADFITYVIAPSKKELDKIAPYTFDYKPETTKTSAKGRKRITAITFYPKYQPSNRDKELSEKDLIAKYSAGVPSIGKPEQAYLMHTLNFSQRQIDNNISLLTTAQSKLDLLHFLHSIRARAEKAKNPQGYIINAIKKELAQL